jgi:ferredoxin-NADP reductase
MVRSLTGCIACRTVPLVPQRRLETVSTVASAARRLVVEGRRNVTADVVELRLRAPDGERLPDWSPGAHIDLVLPSGRVRQYSLCGDPADDFEYRLAVLRVPDGRGGSNEVHDLLATGDLIEIRGPRNNFSLIEAGSYLFIAGGIGITPLLPMLQEAQHKGVPWRLAYGASSSDAMAFRDEVLGLGGNRVQLWPQDELGLLPVRTLLAESEGSEVYCCGPEPLLSAVIGAGGMSGVTPHFERFSSTSSPEALRPARPFDVLLARSGRTVAVPAHQSLLDVLLAIDPGYPYSCREGTCGTCLLNVLEGEIDHRDVLLTEPERLSSHVMLPCVSRAASRRIAVDA